MSSSSPEVLSPTAEVMSSPRSANTAPETASVGIRNSVAQTRQQLADTMETLAQKMDMPSGVKDKWRATKDTTQATIGKATRHLHESKKTAQDKTNEVTQQAKSLTGRAADKIPAPVTERVTDLAQTVRQRPDPAVAIVVAIFALLLLRRFISRATDRP
ncbi:MAG: hypothetical protein JO287_11735 [Pseudonocardiales bacterium]|nr:hypothetical protein [Pseudonocardiales bacterium]